MNPEKFMNVRLIVELPAIAMSILLYNVKPKRSPIPDLIEPVQFIIFQTNLTRIINYLHTALSFQPSGQFLVYVCETLSRFETLRI